MSTSTTGITAIELAALRKADAVSFHTNEADSHICASKRCEAARVASDYGVKVT